MILSGKPIYDKWDQSLILYLTISVKTSFRIFSRENNTPQIFMQIFIHVVLNSECLSNICKYTFYYIALIQVILSFYIYEISNLVYTHFCYIWRPIRDVCSARLSGCVYATSWSLNSLTFYADTMPHSLSHIVFLICFS